MGHLFLVNGNSHCTQSLYDDCSKEHWNSYSKPSKPPDLEIFITASRPKHPPDLSILQTSTENSQRIQVTNSMKKERHRSITTPCHKILKEIENVCTESQRKITVELKDTWNPQPSLHVNSHTPPRVTKVTTVPPKIVQPTLPSELKHLI